MDLRRFDPTAGTPDRGCSHRIRRLVGGSRLALPELRLLCPASPIDLVGVLEADHWVLRLRRRGEADVTPLGAGERWRVTVPQGVRHCLGLEPWVGVSVPPGGGAVVVWSTSRLDVTLEVRA